jgi:mRNA interferase YafQ
VLRSGFTTQFKKDRKLAGRQGKDLSALREVMERLVREESLESRFHDHKLSGKWKGFRECHVEPDWLMIYRVAAGDITFTRLGSHSDLFKT